MGGVEMNNIDELLSRWDEHRTFSDLPFREDMKYCTVTIDEPIKKVGLEELINNCRNKINSGIKNVRRSFEKER
jgi:hypothetical protein